MTFSKSSSPSQPRSGELFLVATPIGNLKDITLRALDVLKAADRIACEDTRTSGVLLKHYGITTPMKAYHTHNEAEATQQLVNDLRDGKRIALISDAGTPLLSDPGARLVKAAIEAGVRVTPIPGASALLSAVTVAGIPAEQFFYAGFLPSKSGARRQALGVYAALQATLVYYEAPHRLLDTLADMREVFGERDAAVARELTKLHEECVRGPLSDLITHFEAHAPRGECVIVVHGAAPAAAMGDEAIDAALLSAMETHSLKEAVALVTEQAGRAKRDIYARALSLKDAP